MHPFRLILPICAALGVAGCVAYPAPPPPRPVYGGPPVYAPPPRVYAPAPRVYAPPPRRRHWVPRRCDGWGRCRGGYWR